MYRDNKNIEAHLIPFWSYKQIIYNSEMRSEILKNIWMFIPLGTILYRIYPDKRIVLFSIILSITIEIIQYITGTGLCEFDDVISNGLGSWIGFVVGKLTVRIRLRIKK